MFAILFDDEKSWLWVLLFVLSISLKLGLVPFHYWIYEVFMNSSWVSIFFLSSVIKVLPLFLVCNVTTLSVIPSYWWVYLGILSVLTGSIGGIGQKTLKGVLRFSSISHTGWMIISTYLSYWTIWVYLLVYTINTSLVLWYKESVLLLGLGGMPPSSGFFPKVLVLTGFIQWPEIVTLLVISRALSLYYYMYLWRGSITSPKMRMVESGTLLLASSALVGCTWILFL